MVLSVRGCLCCGAGPWSWSWGKAGGLGHVEVGCRGCMCLLHVHGHMGVIKDHVILRGVGCMYQCMASVEAAACAGMTMNEKDLETHTHTYPYALTDIVSWFVNKQPMLMFQEKFNK